jgi:hypothetical protein
MRDKTLGFLLRPWQRTLLLRDARRNKRRKRGKIGRALNFAQMEEGNSEARKKESDSESKKNEEVKIAANPRYSHGKPPLTSSL